MPRYRGAMCWILRSGLLAAGLLLAGPDTAWAAVPPLPAAASVAQAAPVLNEPPVGEGGRLLGLGLLLPGLLILGGISLLGVMLLLPFGFVLLAFLVAHGGPPWSARSPP